MISFSYQYFFTRTISLNLLNVLKNIFLPWKYIQNAEKYLLFIILVTSRLLRVLPKNSSFQTTKLFEISVGKYMIKYYPTFYFLVSVFR